MRRSGVRSPSAPPIHTEIAFTSIATLPLIGWRSPACLAQGDGETALHAWAGHHCLVPALDVGKIRQIDQVALVPPGPAEDREIGNRDLTTGELDVAEPFVEHAIGPARLL